MESIARKGYVKQRCTSLQLDGHKPTQLSSNVKFYYEACVAKRKRLWIGGVARRKSG